MDRWLGKTAIVTGTESGMGEEITRALLQNEVNVAALKIQKERLTKLDAERYHGLFFDLYLASKHASLALTQQEKKWQKLLFELLYSLKSESVEITDISAKYATGNQ